MLNPIVHKNFRHASVLGYILYLQWVQEGQKSNLVPEYYVANSLWYQNIEKYMLQPKMPVIDTTKFCPTIPTVTVLSL